MDNPVFSDALTMANMQLRVIEVGEANRYIVCLDSPESERNNKWVAVIVMNGEYTIGQQRELLNRMSETSAPEKHAVLEIKKQMQERLDQCRNDCRELVVFKNYRIRRLAELLRKEQADPKQLAEKSAKDFPDEWKKVRIRTKRYKPPTWEMVRDLEQLVEHMKRDISGMQSFYLRLKARIFEVKAERDTAHKAIQALELEAQRLRAAVDSHALDHIEREADERRLRQALTELSSDLNLEQRKAYQLKKQLEESELALKELTNTHKSQLSWCGLLIMSLATVAAVGWGLLVMDKL